MKWTIPYLIKLNAITSISEGHCYTTGHGDGTSAGCSTGPNAEVSCFSGANHHYCAGGSGPEN